MKLTLTIFPRTNRNGKKTCVIESRNIYRTPTGHFKESYHSKAWEKAIWDELIILRGNGRLPASYVKARLSEKQRKVKITSYRKRLLDHRNLDDKPLMDALVRIDLLRDDCEKWAGRPIVEQVKSKKEYTEIEIEE